jgi:hypothetical protein
MAELVEAAAQVRKQPPVPRPFIEEALQRIHAGQEKVFLYPTGRPSLKDVYTVAVRLESATAVKN